MLPVRNGHRTGCFLNLFVHRRTAVAHSEPTKAFSKRSPETAMLSAPFGCTHPPPPVLPFLLSQNLSREVIAGSDVTRGKFRIYPATSEKGLNYLMLVILYFPCNCTLTKAHKVAICSVVEGTLPLCISQNSRLVVTPWSCVEAQKLLQSSQLWTR